jgi:hypothetical protein
MNQQDPPAGYPPPENYPPQYQGYPQTGFPPPGYYGGMTPAPVPPKKTHRVRTVVLWVVGIFVALIILGNLGGGSTPPTSPAPAPSAPVPTQQAEQAPTQAPGTYSAGTYEVGRDIQPGTYRTQNPNNEYGYWARLSNTSGDFSAIIANGTVSGPGVVTIKSTDAAVTFSGNMEWTAAP